MDTGDVVEVLRQTAAALRSHGPATDALRAIQRARNTLDAVSAELVGELAETDAHREEGASSVKGWLREELHLDGPQASRLQRAAKAMRELPAVRDSANAGRIGVAHVNLFAFSLQHVGRTLTRESEPWLLDVAETNTPAQLKQIVRALREAAFPDDLDNDWIRGMARQDLQVQPVPDGWHVKGFLNTITGAKLKTVLSSLSAPRSAEDDRTAADRRVEGLDELLDGVLEHGLPADGGVRPQVSVIVDAEEIRRQSTDPDATAAPARLAGFGSIGSMVLQMIACGADLTPILTGQKGAVLDVGRSRRFANRAQRRAIIASQNEQCAAPGCLHPVVHIHHITWWSHGGTSDMANLIGLCPGCHTLVHQGKLTILPDKSFERGPGRILRTNPETEWHRRRAAWRRIQHTHAALAS